MLRSLRRSRRCFLGLESLEGKIVPAGLVTAQLLLDGTLQIIGDANNNKIEVSQYGDDIDVKGIGTSVNGVSQIEFDASAVARISISLKGGNDTANLKNLRVPGDITVVDDADKDTYTAYGLQMSTSSLSIQTGVGDDDVEVNSSILGGLFVSTGDDNDDVSVCDSIISLIDVRTDGGKDSVDIEGVLAGSVGVKTGAGNDSIDMKHLHTSILSVNAGAGSDTVEARDVIATTLGLVNGDGGTDLLDDDGSNLFVSLNFEGFI